MMTKIGFIILLLLFGVCTFFAGILAPDKVAAPVEKVASALYEKWAPTAEAAAAGAVEQVEKVVDSQAVDYRSLLTVNKHTQPVGIQVELYTSLSRAALGKAELDGLDIPASILEVSIGGDMRWSLLAAGPYEDRAHAEPALARLRAQYEYRRSLDLIAWPKKQ